MSIPEYDDAPLSVLVVDDEETLRRTCAQLLAAEGYRVIEESRGHAALDRVRQRAPDIVLLDLRLPDASGLELLPQLRSLAAEAKIILITAFATIDSAVEAVAAGAYDYLPKPFTALQLRILVGRAAAQLRLERKNRLLRARLAQRDGFGEILGVSPPMRRIFAVLERVAPTEASVLISGESGTGKELVARALHARSPRAARPFMAINCAALPPNLLESELFGHEKGAFTGADTARVGLLEAAAGGTVFLDEIAEMPLELQAKLLRAIQERRIRRVGSTTEIPIDVRWVAATNRDPARVVAEGRLRADLYFRLNVVPIVLPPLRERPGDVPVLLHHFLRLYGERHGRPELQFSSAARERLETYSWPGNVRELQNVVERCVLLAPGPRIELEDLPVEVRGWGAAAEAEEPSTWWNRPFHEAKAEAIEAFERRYLRRLLETHGGNLSRAARAAGMDRKTLHRLILKHQLRWSVQVEGKPQRPE